MGPRVSDARDFAAPEGAKPLRPVPIKREVIVETILLINRLKVLQWCHDVSKLKWNYMNFVEIGILVSLPSNYCKAVKTRSHK